MWKKRTQPPARVMPEPPDPYPVRVWPLVVAKGVESAMTARTKALAFSTHIDPSMLGRRARAVLQVERPVIVTDVSRGWEVERPGELAMRHGLSTDALVESGFAVHWRAEPVSMFDSPGRYAGAATIELQIFKAEPPNVLDEITDYLAKDGNWQQLVDPIEPVSYEVGYRDGENSAHADWRAALEETLSDETLESIGDLTPQSVAQWIDRQS